MHTSSLCMCFVFWIHQSIPIQSARAKKRGAEQNADGGVYDDRKGKKRPNAPTSPQRCVCVCARARVLKRCVCVCVCVFRFLYSRMSEGSAVRALSESL